MDHKLLKENLESQIISPRILLSNVKFLNERAKETVSFTDPKNLPFYYHLGKQIHPEKVLQIGVMYGSAYIGPCFLQSCKSVNLWLSLDEGVDPQTAGFVRSNLLAHMSDGGDAPVLIGEIESWKRKLDRFEFDMVLISSIAATPTFNEYIEYGWSRLKDEGLLVVDYISEDKPATLPKIHDAFMKFCRVKNREPVVYETRYGVGIVTR